MDVYFVMVTCPDTGKGTRTGVELSELSAFSHLGLLPTPCTCQVCGQTHMWQHADAWLERQQASRVRMRPAITTITP